MKIVLGSFKRSLEEAEGLHESMKN
jgi:hypothetical protein